MQGKELEIVLARVVQTEELATGVLSGDNISIYKISLVVPDIRGEAVQSPLCFVRCVWPVLVM